MTGEQDVERFAGGSRVTGVIGLLITAGIVFLAVRDPGAIPLPVVAGALVAAVLIWSAMLRPRVWVEDGRLVLRNMLETIRIPLAAIEELAVRQVLVLRAGERRFVSSGVGRSMRQALMASQTDSPRATKPALGPALGGGAPSNVEGGIAYADFVEHRIKDLAQLDRERRGIRAYSDEAEALAQDIRREPAYLEIVALVATSVFFVVSLLL